MTSLINLTRFDLCPFRCDGLDRLGSLVTLWPFSRPTHISIEGAIQRGAWLVHINKSLNKYSKQILISASYQHQRHVKFHGKLNTIQAQLQHYVNDDNFVIVGNGVTVIVIDKFQSTLRCNLGVNTSKVEYKFTESQR